MVPRAVRRERMSAPHHTTALATAAQVARHAAKPPVKSTAAVVTTHTPHTKEQNTAGKILHGLALRRYVIAKPTHGETYTKDGTHAWKELKASVRCSEPTIATYRNVWSAAAAVVALDVKSSPSLLAPTPSLSADTVSMLASPAGSVKPSKLSVLPSSVASAVLLSPVLSPLGPTLASETSRMLAALQKKAHVSVHLCRWQ